MALSRTNYDAVIATGSPPIYKLTLGVGDHVLASPDPGPDSLPVIALQRTVLDQTLLETAAAAGVDVQDGTSASGLLHEGAQVFGANGKQSFIAQQVGAEYTSYEAPLNQRVAELPDDPSEIEDRVVALATPELSAHLTPSNGGLAPTAEMS